MRSAPATPLGDEAAGPLVPCPDCGRKFNAESLDKHIRICKKVFQQKRKQFNSAANRWASLDNAEDVIAHAKKIEREREKATEARENNHGAAAQNVPKWKQKSLAFRQAILNAKASTGDAEAQAKADEIREELKLAGDVDSDMTRCPHCSRTFNKEAGERHIAICLKTFGSKPGGGRLIKGGGRSMVGSSAPVAPPAKGGPPVQAMVGQDPRGPSSYSTGSALYRATSNEAPRENGSAGTAAVRKTSVPRSKATGAPAGQLPAPAVPSRRVPGQR